jgi:threonine dehydratase
VQDIGQPLDHVFVSIGGGGFIAGVATALKASWPSVMIHGVETVGADAMTQALDRNAPVTFTPSSIARTLGAPFVTQRTLAVARALLEDVALVPDSAAVAALFSILDSERMLVEPAASCVLAAALQEKARFTPGTRVGLVLCGANVALDDALQWRHQFGLA